MASLRKLFAGLVGGAVGGLGILCTTACSNGNEEQERQNLLKWINHQLEQISQQLEADIEKEKQGFYAHQGKTDYASKGSIEYTLKEKTGARLLVSQHSLLSLDEIKNTEGYKNLLSKADSLSLQPSIKEENIDGDEVESFEELDEYIDDVERYFVITISGW